MLTTYLQKLHLFSRDVRLHLITTALIGFTINGIWAVLFNLYLLRLGYTPEFIGLVHAVSMFVFAMFCLPAGALGTRWGSRCMLIISVTMIAVGSGLLPLVELIPSAWQGAWLLATSACMRIGTASYFVSTLPFVMGVTGSEERDHAFEDMRREHRFSRMGDAPSLVYEKVERDKPAAPIQNPFERKRDRGGVR